MTKHTRYFFAGSAGLLGAGLCAGLVSYYGGGFQALSASTGPTELAYVPADAAVVAYADVRSIMDSELRQRFKQTVGIPEQGRQEFLEKTGIDLERDVDYIVAAMTPGTGHPTGLIVARGRFDVGLLETFARQHGADVQDYKGKRLLTIKHDAREESSPARQDDGTPVRTHQLHAKTGVVAFLEPGLVAVGDLSAVQRSIDAQMSAQSITSNNEIMDLVKDIERSNNAWAVGRFDLIASQAKLPDQIARQIPPVKWFAAAGHINGGVSGQIRAEANDDKAGEHLRGVINGVVSLAKLQGQNDAKVSPLVQSLEMSGSGKSVQLSFVLPAEIFELIAEKAHGQFH